MNKQMLTSVFLFWTLLGVIRAQTRATCNVKVNPSLPDDQVQDLSGVINFSQEVAGGTVTIDVDVEGFDSEDSQLLHGMHVHTSNDFSDGCQSTGGHFNPEGVNHGAPNATIRHVGDLGNIMEDGTGKVKIVFTDDVIDFSGNNSILNRAIVIHAGEDDLGLGGNTGSLTTGNAGARLACCEIVEVDTSSATSLCLNAVVILISFVLTHFIQQEK